MYIYQESPCQTDHSWHFRICFGDPGSIMCCVRCGKTRHPTVEEIKEGWYEDYGSDRIHTWTSIERGSD